jgi:hypothetical protein
LSVPVASSEPRAYAEFNATIARAVANGEPWPQDPVAVARRFAEWGVERLAIWTIEGAGERPSRYEILALADGFHDDSVRGERLEISPSQRRRNVAHHRGPRQLALLAGPRPRILRDPAMQLGGQWN